MARATDTVTGVLFVDKPAGPTSHDVVDLVRWALRTRTVGHCGTLDPAATGLLVVCVGAATRLARYFLDDDKVYQAQFALGAATTTGDGEGEVIAAGPVSDEIVAGLAQAVLALQGEHALAPPAFSAVKVEGQRAHDLARAGQPVELGARPMTVRRVADVAVERGDDDRGFVLVTTTLTVSKGTYIRSLAALLGERLGVPVHLGRLRRLASGNARVDGPAVIAGLEASPWGRSGDGAPRWRIRPAEGPLDREGVGSWMRGHLQPLEAIMPVPMVHLGAGAAESNLLTRLSHGQVVDLPGPGWPPEIPQGAPRFAVAGEGGWIMVRVESGATGLTAHPERVIVAPARSSEGASVRLDKRMPAPDSPAQDT